MPGLRTLTVNSALDFAFFIDLRFRTSNALTYLCFPHTKIKVHFIDVLPMFEKVCYLGTNYQVWLNRVFMSVACSNAIPT